MASMAQPFPHPGAMAGHGGMPPGGHPMAPGHPSNQGMPGGQPGVMAQQMHAMGGPQVSQGQMMNLPQGGPGMGPPNAHAMSHLTPNLLQQQLQQQQQQHMAQVMQNNPHIMQQRVQQQRMMMMQQQQQQQQAQAQAQAQGHANMNMNPNAQQMMMSQMRGVHLPPHLQAMQNQNHPGQFMSQGQQPPQQPTPQHMQQLAAMQAAHQAASQAGSAPGQPAQQQPMRPPSTMGGAPDPQNPTSAAQQAQHQAQQQAQQQQQQQQQAQQQAQQQSNQGQPPGPQSQVTQPPQVQAPQAQAPPQSQGTPQPQPNPQQAAPPQAPQQAQQAQGQQQPQQQPPQQQQGQQPQQNPQQDAAMAAKRHQLQQAQINQMQQQQHQAQVQAARNQAQAMALAGMQQNSMSRNIQLLKLYQFGEQLGPPSGQQGRSPANDIVYWRNFVNKFFAEAGVFRQRLWSTKDESTKEFELATPIIARYFWTHYNNRVQKIQMVMEAPAEKELPNGGCFIESPRTSFIYWFMNGHQIVASGSLRAQINNNHKFDVLEHLVQEYTEHIPLKSMQPESPEQKPSPNVTKGGKKAAAQQRMNKVPAVPRSAVTEWGVCDGVIQLLEIAETFSHMSALFDHARNNPNISAPEALRQLVHSWRSAGQNNMMDGAGQFNPALPQQHSQGTPGPNFNGQQQFASPAPGAHLNLPNTASPASMNMSPAMQAHGLQNAAAGQGPSANTSPSNSNKRRRTSTVKVEGDGDGATPEQSGPKVKQSPRPGKRQKPGA